MDNLKTWIKNQVETASKNGVVLYYDGELNNTVSLFLAIEALGKENVLVVLLPCASHHPEVQKRNEENIKFLQLLKIDYLTIDLSIDYLNCLKAFKNLIEVKDTKSKYLIGNAKSRLRSLILYSLAQIHNYLILGSTNKTEYLLGCYVKNTLGDLEPILDFYRKEIVELAKELNVPDFIIEKKPSLELFSYAHWEEDFKELFGEETTYGEIDNVLTSALEGETLNPQISKEKVNKILNLINQSEHKRNTPLYFEKEL